MLDPGSNPTENAVFLTVLVSVIHALDAHSDLLRSATASLGNDHRLGANEAPPAIISIFLGEQLQKVIDRLMNGTKASKEKDSYLRIGVDALPTLRRDATDRNRTSPFAFTGNKFEFRAPGSSQSCAEVNTILNTIVAEAMDLLSDELERLPADKFNEGLQALLKKEIAAHSRIIFNGDGYNKEWLEEARRRGLPNLPTSLEAITPLKDKKNQTLMEKYHVLSKTEMDSRYLVFKEDYERRLDIEGKVALEIAKNMIRPVAVKELVGLGDGSSSKSVKALRCELAADVDSLSAHIAVLEKALASGKEIIPAMAELRKDVDTLETIVDDKEWPLPKYREMLFIS